MLAIVVMRVMCRMEFVSMVLMTVLGLIYFLEVTD